MGGQCQKLRSCLSGQILNCKWFNMGGQCQKLRSCLSGRHPNTNPDPPQPTLTASNPLNQNNNQYPIGGKKLGGHPNTSPDLSQPTLTASNPLNQNNNQYPIGGKKLGVIDKVRSKMGNVFGDPGLSQFQQKKLLHEFYTFFDLNKDGSLEWKDFDLARKHVCEMSGWTEGSPRYVHTQDLFIDLWRRLQDDGDQDNDGKISCEEWLKMWETFNATSMKEEKKEQKEKDPDGEISLKIPEWLEKYIEYKFNLLDRTGDGHIDCDEFEYALSNFKVPAKEARSAFLLFSQGNQKKVDRKYFRELTSEYFRSDDPGALGNFITGKLEFL